MFRTLIIIALLAAPAAWASSIVPGQPLPELTITKRGELIAEGDDFDYRQWRAPQSIGKVHVLQYLAGRQSARSQSKPFTDRLQQELPLDSYHVTTVINLDDALWGTGGFVVSELKSSKRKYPLSTIVLDEAGAGLRHWDLQPGGATIVVMDAGGTVLFLKEGAMTEPEIDATLELIRANIPGGES